MKLLEKILVPTDFRGSADGALEMAISLAKIFDSEIILLHVLPADWKEKTSTIDLNKIVIEQLALLREKINKRGVKSKQSIAVTGNLLDEIVRNAVKYSVNLIMLGSGEKTEKDHFQLGSTTEKVMRKSSKPVWIVKRKSTATPEYIICPVDYSEPSKRALRNAIHLARGLKAELTVLTVLESLADQIDGITVKLEPESEKLKAEQEAQFEKFLSEFDFHGVKWTKNLLRGKPHLMILKAIRKEKNSLFVMGTNGRSGLNKFIMGSVTERVTRELPSSFITVKSEEFIKVKVENEIKDLETHFKEAKDLLSNGLAEEAIGQFRLCLEINNLYVPAWLGMATAYDRLKDDTNAKSSRNQAKEIQEHFANQKIVAEIRGNHWLAK